MLAFARHLFVSSDPIQPVMSSRCLSAAGIPSWVFHLPLKYSAFLTVGLLLGILHQTPSGFHVSHHRV
jgi:hypothetical protein